MSEAVQPVTFLVPGSATKPIEVRVAHSGLRMMLVNRESIGLLDASWRVLGIYFLLGAADDPQRYSAYVGEVGRRDLLTRLREHVAGKPWWSRALLVTSAYDDFNSAEIGWLEGRFYDVLNNAVAADLMNRGRPGDDSLALHDVAVLERYVEPVTAALRACGTPPDTADQRPAPKGAKRAYYRESLRDLIDAGLLKAGTRLRPMRAGLTRTALVLADGNLDVDGEIFTAVSPAAQMVSGNRAEPGWEFWGVPSGDGGHVALFDLRARLRDDRDRTTTAPTASASRADDAVGAPRRQAVASGDGRAPDQRPRAVQRRTSTRYSETIADLIAADLLPVGARLRSVRQRLDVLAVVHANGEIEFEGKRYRTPSPAAQAASGSKAEPGWEFWALDELGGPTLFALRAELRARGRRSD